MESFRHQLINWLESRSVRPRIKNGRRIYTALLDKNLAFSVSDDPLNPASWAHLHVRLLTLPYGDSEKQKLLDAMLTRNLPLAVRENAGLVLDEDNRLVLQQRIPASLYPTAALFRRQLAHFFALGKALHRDLAPRAAGGAARRGATEDPSAVRYL